MKRISLSLVASLIYLITQGRCDPVILDSFSEGGFNLSWLGPVTDNDLITPSPMRFRQTRGEGGLAWTATLDPSVGILRYQTATRSAPDAGYYLSLDYFNSGTFNIAAYTAFYFALPDVSGTGELYVGFNSHGPSFSTPHPIFQPGEIFYNLSYVTSSEWQQPINSVQFYIFPTSNNFSVGVDHIALIPAVPEPGSALLLLTGTGILAMRRRRGVA
jgi:hypothetical protein